MRYSLCSGKYRFCGNPFSLVRSKPKACRTQLILEQHGVFETAHSLKKKQIAKTFKLSIFHCVNSEALNHPLHILLFPFFLCHVITVFQASPSSSQNRTLKHKPKRMGLLINWFPVLLERADNEEKQRAYRCDTEAKKMPVSVCISGELNAPAY